jgi:hypothetical protein
MVTGPFHLEQLHGCRYVECTYEHINRRHHGNRRADLNVLNQIALKFDVQLKTGRQRADPRTDTDGQLIEFESVSIRSTLCERPTKRSPSSHAAPAVPVWPNASPLDSVNVRKKRTFRCQRPGEYFCIKSEKSIDQLINIAGN